jgi:hypothetical protein
MMIEDMAVRNLSPATQRSYLNAVAKFCRYFGRPADHLGLEDVHVRSRFTWWRTHGRTQPNRLCIAVLQGVTLGHSAILESHRRCTGATQATGRAEADVPTRR